MSETMLELRGVSKSFGHKPVLKEVDLSLSAGSVLGLVGKNGAGKTTLLKCALGLQHPQRGDVRILGEPAWELSAAGKERLGYVPQKIDLYPWMKIRQITAYTGRFLSQVEQGPCRTAAARMGAEPGRPRRVLVGWPDAKASHHLGPRS